MSISAYFYIERDKKLNSDDDNLWKVFTDDGYRFWSFYKQLDFNDVYTNNALAWYLSQFSREASELVIHNKTLFFDKLDPSNRSRCWSKEVEDLYSANSEEFTGLGTMYLDDFVNNELWDNQSTSNELVSLISIENALKDNGKIDYRKLHFSTFEATGDIALIPFSQCKNKIEEMRSELFNNPELYSNDMDTIYSIMRKYENMYTMMRVTTSPRMYCKLFFDTFKDEFNSMLSDYKLS